MTNYIERYWRDAKPEDAIKEPPMWARFRASVNQEWVIDTLQGIDRSEPSKWRGKDITGRLCQVYDAPDPGEGWRLIDVEKEERVPSDERWHPGLQKWLSPEDCYSDHYEKGVFYRRRITPTVTYVPFTWEDREQLRGRWMCDGKNNVEILASAMHLNSSGVFYVEGRSAKVLLDRFIFVDTGEPVGRKVTQ